MESVFDLFVKVGLSDHAAVQLLHWLSDAYIWLVGANVLIARAIKHLRDRNGNSLASWALLGLVVVNAAALSVVSSAELGLALAWVVATSLTLTLALGRKLKRRT